MKKMSNELIKSYFFMIGAFLVMNIVLLGAFWKYLLVEASRDLRRGYNTITLELEEEDNQQDINHFAEDISKELPVSTNLRPVFEYEGKIYGLDLSDKIPDFKKYPVNQNIELEFYKYLLERRELSLKDGKVIDMILVKDLKTERRTMVKLIKIFSVGNLIVILLGIIITKYFYDKFVPQINKLVETTNKINLKSFEIDFEEEEFYSEFKSILNAYKRMTARLEKETSAQIEFVHNASHELKTPIFIIKGYVDLMKRWGLEDKEIAQESLDSIQNEIKEMQSLVEKLLFIAKNDKVKPVLEKVDLSDILTDILMEMKIIYPEQKFDFNSEAITITTDWALLKQLLRNLIDNAVKYGGGEKITISLGDTGSKVEVLIQDRGIGMSQEELERVFEKFYRADKSRNKAIKGHGLGLSIVKTILEILKGEVEFKSEPDKGTLVKVTLPKG